MPSLRAGSDGSWLFVMPPIHQGPEGPARSFLTCSESVEPYQKSETIYRKSETPDADLLLWP